MVSKCDASAKRLTDFENNFDRNVFVIMRYADEPVLEDIKNAIKSSLQRYGLNAILAQDVTFDEELWGNIKICMDNCRFAIVVFERSVQPEHNPNITLELGYMLALRRSCLILKEKSLPTLPTDIIGRLYTPFDFYRAKESITSAIENWLKKIGIKESHLAQTITGNNPLEANKLRTQAILDALPETKDIIRQAASLSSLGISANERHKDDFDGKYQGLLICERQGFISLLENGIKVRLIICPDAQIDRIELKLVSNEYINKNILPRYDQLLKIIANDFNNPNLQIVYTLRLPHDNLLIIDDKVAFIGRKRRRDRGFPYTTKVADPAVIHDEIMEFDNIFHDNVGALLNINEVCESHYSSPELKNKIIEKLKKSKNKIKHILRKQNNKK